MKYVALLRGINVGGNCKVDMKKLAKVFEFMGYKNVSTYINTGNVIFEFDHAGSKSPVKLDKDTLSRATQDIESTLHKQFGFKIPVVIRSAREIQSICTSISDQWKNDTDQRTDVLFLWPDFNSSKTLRLIEHDRAIDILVYVKGGGVIVWNMSRENYTKSKMKKFIGTQVYKHMTARNINTVRKLKELMQ